MSIVEKLGIVLSPTCLKFENTGVLNPRVHQEGDTVHVFYRATEEGNFSTIGYAKLNGPTKIIERMDRPIIVRDFDYEKQGVEDPRIVKIEDTYYLTYTAYEYHTGDFKDFFKPIYLVPNIQKT